MTARNTINIGRIDIMEVYNISKYNYRDSVYADIALFVEENNIDVSDFDDSDWDDLYDRMFVSDSVTGNASGSYTFDRWDAEENLCHNLDLLAEACDEFGCKTDILSDSEGCDVTVRCYLLGECLQRYRREIEKNNDEDDD